MSRDSQISYAALKLRNRTPGGPLMRLRHVAEVMEDFLGAIDCGDVANEMRRAMEDIIGRIENRTVGHDNLDLADEDEE